MKTALLESKKVDYIKCDGCNEDFPINSNKFLTFWGNVHVGVDGGIIGNNLITNPTDATDIKVDRVSVYCVSCALNIIDYGVGHETFLDAVSHQNNSRSNISHTSHVDI